MKTLISKLITLSLVAFFGTVYFATFLFPPQEINLAIYYALIMYPVILLYMSPGILVSYLVDFIKRYTQKAHLLYSAGIYLTLCFLFFYMPFLLVQKENSIHAVFYFLFIPVLYSLLEYIVIKNSNRVNTKG